MKEEFLQFVWQHGLFSKDELATENKEKIQIIVPGVKNNDAGPDFINAKIKIGNTLWAGNVEIHINSSDWYKHNHDKNKTYNNVILQAVYKNDKVVIHHDNQSLPTIELKFGKKLFDNYQSLLTNKKWIACQDKITLVDKFIINNMLDSLLAERLQDKSETIACTFKQTQKDWSETFYIHLAKNFGFKINGTPFEMLARSVALKKLVRHKSSLIQLEAILFGQAGFLKEKIDEDEYYNLLVKEYNFLKAKFNLKPVENHLWKFLRLRPGNFPTIRIAQFAALIHHSSFLFSKIIETVSLEKIRQDFSNYTSDYWNNHYQFGKKTSNATKKRIGKESFNNIVINTISPFLFFYGLENGKEELKNRALNFLLDLPPETNHTIKKWAEIGIKPDNAFQSQALLQLKNKYCKEKKCLNCQIGSKIIICKINET